MSATGRTYLVCNDYNHADFVDHLVMARLIDVEQATGSSWSGVWTDGTRYGILWAAPVSTLFGQPEDFPELVLVDEDSDAPWTLVVPQAEPQEDV
jgi:hypothetical protein